MLLFLELGGVPEGGATRLLRELREDSEREDKLRSSTELLGNEGDRCEESSSCDPRAMEAAAGEGRRAAAEVARPDKSTT